MYDRWAEEQEKGEAESLKREKAEKERIEKGNRGEYDRWAEEQEKGEAESLKREKQKYAWMKKGKLLYASKHPKVRQLQTLLNSAGAIPPVAVDQQFFKATLRAVKVFQKSHGLKADGVVGEKTWRALGGTGELPSVYEQGPKGSKTA